MTALFQGNVLVQSQIINGQIRRGRFGSCIASAKDLDQNGYNDIIVGAPYENEQRGAIYIFRGFPLGLETIYSQRIVAESLDPQLRGFGISISTAVDVDGNKYNGVTTTSTLLRFKKAIKCTIFFTCCVQTLLLVPTCQVKLFY